MLAQTVLVLSLSALVSAAPQQTTTTIPLSEYVSPLSTALPLSDYTSYGGQPIGPQCLHSCQAWMTATDACGSDCFCTDDYTEAILTCADCVERDWQSGGAMQSLVRSVFRNCPKDARGCDGSTSHISITPYSSDPNWSCRAAEQGVYTDGEGGGPLNVSRSLADTIYQATATSSSVSSSSTSTWTETSNQATDASSISSSSSSSSSSASASSSSTLPASSSPSSSSSSSSTSGTSSPLLAASAVNSSSAPSSTPTGAASSLIGGTSFAAFIVAVVAGAAGLA